MKYVNKVLLFVPVVSILLLGALLLIDPESSYNTISYMRFIVGDKLSSYYLTLGFLFICILLYLAFSKFGDIKLGDSNPDYNMFQWGCMIFTSTMAADIVYFSLHEWAYYYNANPTGLKDVTLYDNQLWSSMYPLFHWGPTPWVFYILPALAYAYILYVRKYSIYRMSQACSIKNKKLATGVDIFALMALLIATSTTFSLATPLLTEALCSVLNLGEATACLTVLVLLIVAIVYTTAVLFDWEGINKLASSCVYIFLLLLVLILSSSNLQYTIETGLSGIGNLLQNFVSLSLNTGSLRLVSDSGNTFTQDWTVFYWAYWISWSIATPFFIARISKGRTVRQVALGAMVAGLLGTYLSFIVLGNFGLYHQISGNFDMVSSLNNTTAASSIVTLIEGTTYVPRIILSVLFISMVSFYASTFDALTMVASQYVCKNYTSTPSKSLKLLWSVTLIVFPIALIFTESTLYSLQALNIIFAFPVSLILIRIIYVFLRSLKSYKV